MGAIVYGAVRGSYSDYQVCALFETMEKAEAWVEAHTIWRPCGVCKGTGTLKTWDGMGDVVQSRECPHCRGTSKVRGNDYGIEEFPWNLEPGEEAE